VIRSDDGIAGLRGGRPLLEQLVQEIAVHAGDLPRVDGRLRIEALRNGFMIGHGCGDLACWSIGTSCVSVAGGDSWEAALTEAKATRTAAAAGT